MLRSILLAATLAAVLAGCGSSGTTATVTVTTGSSGAATTSAAAATTVEMSADEKARVADLTTALTDMSNNVARSFDDITSCGAGDLVTLSSAARTLCEGTLAADKKSMAIRAKTLAIYADLATAVSDPSCAEAARQLHVWTSTLPDALDTWMADEADGVLDDAGFDALKSATDTYRGLADAAVAACT